MSFSRLSRFSVVSQSFLSRYITNKNNNISQIQSFMIAAIVGGELYKGFTIPYASTHDIKHKEKEAANERKFSAG